MTEILEPRFIAMDLSTIAGTSFKNSPRSLWLLPGPSEIGGCRIKLVHKIVGDVEPYRRPSLAAFIGTCFHAGMEAAVSGSDIQNACVAEPRFLLEHKVCVGEAGGHEITGSVDVFDKDAGVVADYKLVGDSSYSKYRLHGPSDVYRTQAHLYGRGLAREGWVVNHVMIIFFKRNGATFDDYHVWSEPYDESVALKAMSRLNGLYELVAAIGAEAVLAGLEPCTDWFCPWCSRRAAPRPPGTPMFAVNSGTPLPRSRNAAALFGAGKEIDLPIPHPLDPPTHPRTP